MWGGGKKLVFLSFFILTSLFQGGKTRSLCLPQLLLLFFVRKLLFCTLKCSRLKQVFFLYNFHVKNAFRKIFRENKSLKVFGHYIEKIVVLFHFNIAYVLKRNSLFGNSCRSENHQIERRSTYYLQQILHNEKIP